MNSESLGSLNQLYFSKYSFEKMDPETDLNDQVAAGFRLNTQISKNIHDQGTPI